MSRPKARASRRRGSSWRAVVLGLGWLVAAAPASAGPIRPHQRLAVARAAQIVGRDAYFLRALQGHWMHVQVPRGLRLESLGGLLPQTPLVQYLEWRRGLAPARFDRYHPRWAAALSSDMAIRATWFNPPPIAPGQIQLPVKVADAGFPTPPAVLPRQSIQTPEPGSAAIALTLFGTAALARRRRGARAA